MSSGKYVVNACPPEGAKTKRRKRKDEKTKAKRRKDESEKTKRRKRKDEKTKRRKDESEKTKRRKRKDEKTKAKKTKRRKDESEKTKRRKRKDESEKTKRRKRKDEKTKAKRRKRKDESEKTLNSGLHVFVISLFRLRYFVMSPSLFRYVAFVISSFRLFAFVFSSFRYGAFVMSPRNNEKTKWHKSATIRFRQYYLLMKLRHTIDISNYWSWFPFLDNCPVWLKFLFFVTFTQLFCKRHYPVIVIPKTRMYTVICTCLYILLSYIEIIKAWPLCDLWTRGHAYLLTQLYKIKTFG